MITKLRHINRNVNPFGGILFCIDEIRKLGIPALIDKHLGKRVKQAKYKYSDVMLSWVYSMLCGSERLEDTKHLKKYLSEIPDTLHPSPDRIAHIFKHFATPITHYKEMNIKHEFNYNERLNKLLVDVAFKLKLLNKKCNYILDYDNIVIPCEKYDAKYTFKKCDGYLPGVAFIGKCPVYIEGRNGNSGVKYKMEDTLNKVFDLMDEKGIKIKTFRSDAGAYSQYVISMLEKRKIEFFIRASNSHRIFAKGIDKFEWKRAEIGNRIWEVASAKYRFTNAEWYRVVFTKSIDNNPGYKNKFTDDGHVYRGIITNNTTMTDEEVIQFYNDRGAMETNFTQLLNDWNWKRLPFSYLNQNVVFMIMGAIGNLLYQHIIRKFSKKIPFIKPSYRLKNFIFHFVAVSLEWLVEEQEKIPIIYGDKDYSKLI